MIESQETLPCAPAPLARTQSNGKATEDRGGPCPRSGQRLLAVPVLPDGSPDWEHRLIGVLQNLNAKGAVVELDSPADLPVTELVLVLPDPGDGMARCAGMEVRAALRLGPERLEVWGPFGGLADALLRPENLAPRFRPEPLAFAPAFPESVLQKWAEVGILRPVLADRVLLCPRCHGLPSFRPGCPNCGGVHVASDQFIHHFTCAHVGLVESFLGQEEVICPKCRTRRLVVGSDYEYLTGPPRCLECHWTGAELEHVAQCLRCGLRFPGSQALLQDLTGYHVERLAPLAG